MKRTIRICLGLLALTLLASCSDQPTVVGLWQSTEEAGTLEFKSNGEVTVVDNMSATMGGRFEIDEGRYIKIEWTSSDILRESIEPMPPITVRLEFDLDGDHLKIHDGENGAETYYRIE